MSRLQNDCFALPPGINWTPVTEALDHLQQNLTPVAGVETLPLNESVNRFLAKDIFAQRTHPPTDNAAVDGYAFAASSQTGDHQTLHLVPGRAAAGHAFSGVISQGQAVRILTGAPMPDGADTVIMQEDVRLAEDQIQFDGYLKPGTNRRRAGENLERGQMLFPAGHLIKPQDLAQLAAAGVGDLFVYKPLRVAILSTGDELLEPGQPALAKSQIYDSNRPMLSTLVHRLGMALDDHGILADDADSIHSTMRNGAIHADVIITSGGASGGDEDHIAQGLNERGTLSLWRIAVKPGRPLALGMLNSCGRNVPVFGLPGNPVAVFVCFLIFVRPALMRLAGGEWSTPQGYGQPSGFDHNKKPGRTEYLRVKRHPDGTLEKFHSEGSGLIGGLSWSTGLVHLPHDHGPLQKGEMVEYLPYESFGI